MHRLNRVSFDFLSFYYIEENSFLLDRKGVSTALIMKELSQIVHILEEYDIRFEVDEGYNIHIF